MHKFQRLNTCWPFWGQGNWDATRVTTTPTPSRTTSASISASAASLAGTTEPIQSQPSQTNKPSSQAWIAGPVVGAVLGIVVVFPVGMLCQNRRSRNRAITSDTGLAIAGHNQRYGFRFAGGSPAKAAYYPVGAPANNFYEMPGYNEVVVEADGRTLLGDRDSYGRD
ncbi:hypothetical protein BCR34DRAFT_564661 [Clohesyomyces aquaticus]|uniref:Uncharacterized protein n=1 Tax=Clohesyomyces aquaticus TaxID=1231657 RepID=A0A1Y1ZNG2_9PLEO|nr:hypothetical protein BCR34DRAFT_564661 [Clohesyomyces aquaticus]